MENQYFVQVKTPVEIRKNVLGASKELIQVLQRFERIKTIRVKKIEKMAKLRALNKEIYLGVAKMKQKFPAVDIRTRPVKHKSVKNSKVDHQSNELMMLEDELKMIENKLSRL